MPQNHENEFHKEMLKVYQSALTECSYPARRFLQAVNQQGGLKAAKALLASDKYSEGLTKLWEAGRLDISMEALVIKQPWVSLFTEEEIAMANKRLGELGYIARA